MYVGKLHGTNYDTDKSFEEVGLVYLDSAIFNPSIFFFLNQEHKEKQTG